MYFDFLITSNKNKHFFRQKSLIGNTVIYTHLAEILYVRTVLLN